MASRNPRTFITTSPRGGQATNVRIIENQSLLCAGTRPEQACPLEPGNQGAIRIPTDGTNGNVDIARRALRANAVHVPKYQVSCGRAGDNKLHAKPLRSFVDVGKQRCGDGVHGPLFGNFKAGKYTAHRFA